MKITYKVLFELAFACAAIPLLLWLASLPTHAGGPWYVAPSGSDLNTCQSAVASCASINGAIGKATGGDLIYVATGTYTNTGNEVVLINKDITLSGGWDISFTFQNSTSTLDAERARRGVIIDPGVSAQIDRFTITRGEDISNNGAGIYNNGSLSLTNSSLITNSTQVSGGAIWNTFSATLSIDRVTIAHNFSYTSGAIANFGGLTVTNSTFDGNSTTYLGGAIYNANHSGLIMNSTFVNNSSVYYGGAIRGERISITNSTFYGNSAARGGAVSGVISVSVTNSTLYGNRTTGGTGGAIDAGFPLTVSNTVIANSLTGGNCSGSVISLGHNLDSGNTCALNATGDLTNTNPLLGPLADNGGPTLTMALLPNSPAIDAAANCPPTDQRGLPRGGNCDIGAYELQPFEFSNKIVTPSRGSPGNAFSYSITLSNPGGADIPSVLMTDTVPISIAYTIGSLTATSGSYGYSSGVITWTGTVNAGSNVSINFSGTLSATQPFSSTVDNTAIINGGGEIFRRTATITVPERKAYLPMVFGCRKPGIHGFVTFQGNNAGMGVSLDLRFYNGSSFSTIATTTTGPDGSYHFDNAPTLGPGQAYYVRYLNNVDNTRLSFWGTRFLTAYSAGYCVPIGDFDIGNIFLASPPSGATVSLPQTFSWTPRLGVPTDSYEFDLFNPFAATPQWWTPKLGYVGSYYLTGLPAGFYINTQYGWFMAVYSPDGGYGESYYYRRIIFSNYGFGPARLPDLEPGRTDRDAPPPNRSQ